MSPYIERIYIHQVRHLRDLEIKLGRSEDGSPKHLILTGPNGSGKTSLLEALRKNLGGVEDGSWLNVPDWKRAVAQIRAQMQTWDLQGSSLSERPGPEVMLERAKAMQTVQQLESLLDRFSQLDVEMGDAGSTVSLFSEGSFPIAFFPTNRQTQMVVPSGVLMTKPEKRYGIADSAREDFLNYLVHLTVQRSFARDGGDTEGVEKINAWFDKFEGALRDLYNDKELKLLFDRDNYRHTIQLSDGREPFDLNQLADGYHAMLSVLNELIFRMEAKASRVYDLPGIALIDEVETHLHIELQKKALPFLTSFFPKVQFIATTHSPFVLSSLPNAVVFDLATRLRVEDLSGYPSEVVVEGYFGQNRYSDTLRKKLEEYRALLGKGTRTEDEEDRLDDLRTWLHELPKAFSPELEGALREIEGV